MFWAPFDRLALTLFYTVSSIGFSRKTSGETTTTDASVTYFSRRSQLS